MQLIRIAKYSVAFFTDRYIIILSHNKLVQWVKGERENMIKMSAVSISRSRSTLCWQEIKLQHIATVSFSIVIIVHLGQPRCKGCRVIMSSNF